MARPTEDVKTSKMGPLQQVVHWIDCHPRTGWYVSVVATLNLVLNLLDLFK